MTRAQTELHHALATPPGGQLLVVSRVCGEVVLRAQVTVPVSARAPTGQEDVYVFVRSSLGARQPLPVNLLAYAPLSSWRGNKSLIDAVREGLVKVVPAAATGAGGSTSTTGPPRAPETNSG